MRAADAHFEVFARSTAGFDGYFDELADALLIEDGEGIGLEDLLLQIYQPSDIRVLILAWMEAELDELGAHGDTGDTEPAGGLGLVFLSGVVG